jgi:hypothetical protein
MGIAPGRKLNLGGTTKAQPAFRPKTAFVFSFALGQGRLIFSSPGGALGFPPPPRILGAKIGKD